MTKVLTAALAAIAMIMSGALAADPLTDSEVQRFAKTLPDVQSFGEKMEAKTDIMGVEMQPKAGEPFQPYTKAVARLKADHPGEHGELRAIVKPHGFSTEDWASVGDRVMVAYMALVMEEEDPRTVAMMENFDESMLDMMPPAAREQIEASFAMLETVRTAPEADKAMVKRHRAELDEHFDMQTGRR